MGMRGRTVRRRGGVGVAAVAFAIALVATASPSLAASVKTATVKAAGVSFQYPASWTSIPVTKQELDASVNRLAKKNPRLAKAIQSGGVALSQATKFIAKDLGAQLRGAQFSDNAVVLVQSGFPSSLDQFRSELQATAQQSGFSIINALTVQVGGTQAYRADLREPVVAPNGTRLVLHSGELFVSHGGGSGHVEVTTLDDARGAKIIDGVFASVRRI